MDRYDNDVSFGYMAKFFGCWAAVLLSLVAVSGLAGYPSPFAMVVGMLSALVGGTAQY